MYHDDYVDSALQGIIQQLNRSDIKIQVMIFFYLSQHDIDQDNLSKLSMIVKMQDFRKDMEKQVTRQRNRFLFQITLYFSSLRYQTKCLNICNTSYKKSIFYFQKRT